MIYKSYLIEGNLNKIKQKIILFYGENFGLKNTFKNEIKLKTSKWDLLLTRRSSKK